MSTTKRKHVAKCSFCKRSTKKAGRLLQASPQKSNGHYFMPRICEQCAYVALYIFTKKEEQKTGGADNSGPAPTSGENPNEQQN